MHKLPLSLALNFAKVMSGLVNCVAVYTRTRTRSLASLCAQGDPVGLRGISEVAFVSQVHITHRFYSTQQPCHHPHPSMALAV